MERTTSLSILGRTSSVVTRIKNNLIYHRMYSDPPPRSELAMSQLTDDGLPAPPPPLQASRIPTPPPPARPPAVSFSTGPLAFPVRATKRRVRFVCMSDTHTASPLVGVFSAPPGDVLIHAGDFTNQGSDSEILKTVEWLKRLPHPVKLIIAGNHDGVTLDPAFHAEYSHCFKTPTPQSHADNLALLTSDEARESGIHYLNHESRHITLSDGRHFRVFGSPYSPRNGLWGFGYSEAPTLESSIWADVPDDTDVLITHTPPRFHLDAKPASETPVSHQGCEHLRQTLWRVRPALHVFGHVHEAWGAERVIWDTDSKFVKYRELDVTPLEDRQPHSRKKFRVDLVKEPLVHGSETCLVNPAIAKGPWREGGDPNNAKWRRKSIIVDWMCPVAPEGSTTEEGEMGITVE